MKEGSERSSNSLTEGNVAFERSRSSGQGSDIVTGATKESRSDLLNTTNPFDERCTQQRYNARSSAAHSLYQGLHGMERDDASDDDWNDQMS